MEKVAVKAVYMQAAGGVQKVHACTVEQSDDRFTIKLVHDGRTYEAYGAKVEVGFGGNPFDEVGYMFNTSADVDYAAEVEAVEAFVERTPTYCGFTYTIESVDGDDDAGEVGDKVYVEFESFGLGDLNEDLEDIGILNLDPGRGDEYTSLADLRERLEAAEA